MTKLSNTEAFAVINNTAKSLMKYMEKMKLNPQRVQIYDYTKDGVNKRVPVIDRFKFIPPTDFGGFKCAFGYSLPNLDDKGNAWAHIHRLPKDYKFSTCAKQLNAINEKIEKIHEYGIELEYLPSSQQTEEGQNIRLSGSRDNLEKYSKDVFPLDIFIHETYGLTAYTSKDSWNANELDSMDFETGEVKEVSGDTETPEKKDIEYNDGLGF